MSFIDTLINIFLFMTWVAPFLWILVGLGLGWIIWGIKK